MTTPSAPPKSGASSSNFLSEVLSCPVCLELYKEPKVLACGHSLCEQCTATLAKRARQVAALMPGQRLPEISCPQCRSITVTANENALSTNYALADVVSRYAFLDSQSQYRHCTICQERRAQKGVFTSFCRAIFGKLMMFSKAHRQRQTTSQQLHDIHEALEADILHAQTGNAKVVDLLHQIIHAMQAQARERFDAVAYRLESDDCSPSQEKYNFILADAELVRAQNQELCTQTMLDQENICNQLQVCLNELKRASLGFDQPTPRSKLDMKLYDQKLQQESVQTPSTSSASGGSN